MNVYEELAKLSQLMIDEHRLWLKLAKELNQEGDWDKHSTTFEEQLVLTEKKIEQFVRVEQAIAMLEKPDKVN